MFDSETKSAIAREARRIGVEPAALEAVVQVESAGVVYAVVNGRNQPVIRFEGHYFDKRLKGAARAQARALGLASPKAGAVKNPKDQAGRWKLLNRAVAIDANAALESTSWGVGQVMGAHWSDLGYASAAALVNKARSGAAGQVELMVRYIEKAGLAGALKRRDWAAFARGYNGKDFAKGGYHLKMAAAYVALLDGAAAPSVPSALGMLRMGSSGERVRELQRLLVRAGLPVAVDGDFGRATHKAVEDFQGLNRLEVDGVAGPATMQALDRYRQGAAEQPGALKVAEIKDVRDGVGVAVGGGLSIEAARQAIESAGAQVAGLPSFSWLSAGLAAAAALLALGGLGYAAWGWWMSRRTIEAPDEDAWAQPEPDALGALA